MVCWRPHLTGTRQYYGVPGSPCLIKLGQAFVLLFIFDSPLAGIHVLVDYKSVSVLCLVCVTSACLVGQD